MKYRCNDGDVLDAICASQYPDINPSDAMPYVLDANPNLAQYTILPRGLIIDLPEIETPQATQSDTIKLWD